MIVRCVAARVLQNRVCTTILQCPKPKHIFFFVYLHVHVDVEDIIASTSTSPDDWVQGASEHKRTPSKSIALTEFAFKSKFFFALAACFDWIKYTSNKNAGKKKNIDTKRNGRKMKCENILVDLTNKKQTKRELEIEAKLIRFSVNACVDFVLHFFCIFFHHFRSLRSLNQVFQSVYVCINSISSEF